MALLLRAWVGSAISPSCLIPFVPPSSSRLVLSAGAAATRRLDAGSARVVRHLAVAPAPQKQGQQGAAVTLSGNAKAKLEKEKRKAKRKAKTMNIKVRAQLRVGARGVGRLCVCARTLGGARGAPRDAGPPLSFSLSA